MDCIHRYFVINYYSCFNRIIIGSQEIWNQRDLEIISTTKKCVSIPNHLNIYRDAKSTELVPSSVGVSTANKSKSVGFSTFLLDVSIESQSQMKCRLNLQLQK